MLDAAVIMMQQYSAAAAASVQVPQAAAEAAPAAGASQPTENVSNGTAHANPNASAAECSTAKEAVDVANGSAEDQPVSQEEELRRRRLQKFQQPQEQ